MSGSVGCCDDCATLSFASAIMDAMSLVANIGFGTMGLSDTTGEVFAVLCNVPIGN